jgi:hypothetical protein
VLAFYLVDGAPLVAKANDVLRHQPFNLRAPVQRQHIGTADVYLYARRTNQPIEVAIMIDRGLGFVISRATPAVDLIDVARALAQTTPDHSLAAHPDFDTQVARFNDYPGFIFIDTEAASSFYRQRFSDQLSASGEQALDEVETNLRSLAGGARLEDLQLDVEAVLTVNPDLVAATAGIDAAPDEPPALGRFVLPSTFAAVRLGANPRLLWETFLRLQGDQLADRIRTHQDEIEHDLGVSLNDDVAPALTGQALVMVNRLAPLSLIRAESPADYADAVDFLAVFQLADRDRAVRVMDSLAAHSDGAYERTQDGDVLRYSTGRGASGFGNVLIGNHLLVVAADRMRRQAEQLIGLSPTAEATPGLTSLVPEAQALVSDNSATGLFLNFERLVPIAQLLNYPQAVRDLLGFLDTLVVRLETTETGLRIRGTLTFKPAEAE